MISEIVSVFLLLGCGALFGALLSVHLRFIPLSACLIIGGLLCAVAVEYLGLETGIRAHNFQDLVFFVILPVLIFEATYSLPQRELLHFLPAVIVMATLGLLISMLISGFGIWLGIDHAGFPFHVALLTGALLSATDPVAVVNQIRELNAPSRLGLLIEGESLFNDAMAIVVFSVLLMVALHGGNNTLGANEIFLYFGKVFFGGIAVGIVLGALHGLLEKLLGEQAPSSYISLLIAYGAFYLAEHTLHVSGVMAVLSAALYISWHHQHPDRSRQREQNHVFWQSLNYPFNAVVFVLMGLVITVEMFTERWLAILIAIPAALLGRIVAVYISIWLSGPLCRQSIPQNYRPVMVWGGLRGVVTIALALSLPAELDERFTVRSIAFGIVLFTLFVQAPSTPWLLRRLKIIE